MCGLAAIFSYHYASLPIDYKELIRIRDHMKERGPDSEGVWISPDNKVGLGHKRLSIIDLSNAANQPMVNKSNELVIIFNGEIYNYKELRSNLKSKGYHFHTSSDTEVLLHLYQDKGEKMVYDLRGMFAFVIWDKKRRTMFLARDPYGIKPLYYADDGWTVRIASQVKALIAGGKISKDFDPAGCAGFYLFGCVPEPYTLYRQIRALPAGSYCWINQLGVNQPIKYFSLAKIYYEAEKNFSLRSKYEQYELVRESLLESVRAHLVSDVPIGVFLSSGLDSSTLVGLMKDVGHEHIQTITLDFEEFKGSSKDESVAACELAKYYQTIHINRRVSIDEFIQDWPLIVEKMDQPSIDGINTWYVSKAAHEHGLKVALSGIGGDELFGGYNSFQRIPRLVRLLNIPARIPFVSNLFSNAIEILLRIGIPLHPKTAGLFNKTSSYMGAYLLQRGLFLPYELKKIANSEFIMEGIRRLKPLQHIQSYLQPKPKKSFSKVAVLESSLYLRNQLLRDADWASMAHSVEVRMPFVDAVLVNQIASLLCHRRQRSKKEILEKIPKKPLPKIVTRRNKTGFLTPIENWLSVMDNNTHSSWWCTATSSRLLAFHLLKKFDF